MVVVKIESDGKDIYCVVFYSIYTSNLEVVDCCEMSYTDNICVKIEDIPEYIEKEAIEKARKSRIDYWLGGDRDD